MRTGKNEYRYDLTVTLRMKGFGPMVDRNSSAAFGRAAETAYEMVYDMAADNGFDVLEVELGNEECEPIYTGDENDDI